MCVHASVCECVCMFKSAPVLLFCVCPLNKCASSAESWQEVADYCSGRPPPLPPAAAACLQPPHLNIDQTPGRTVWVPGPLACSTALLIGTKPSRQYHSSTRARWLSSSVLLSVFVHVRVCVCVSWVSKSVRFSLLYHKLRVSPLTEAALHTTR